MTRGKVVILGPTGRNFAAGMSGGEAYVLDEFGKFSDQSNLGLVSLETIQDLEDISDLQRLIRRHANLTGSANAHRILADWDDMLQKFVKVMPNDYKRVLQEAKNAQDKVGAVKDG